MALRNICTKLGVNGRHLDIEIKTHLALHTQNGHRITQRQIHELLVILLLMCKKPRKNVPVQSEKISQCSDTIVLSLRTYKKHKVSVNKSFEICHSPTAHKPSEEDMSHEQRYKQHEDCFKNEINKSSQNNFLAFTITFFI